MKIKLIEGIEGFLHETLKMYSFLMGRKKLQIIKNASQTKKR